MRSGGNLPASLNVLDLRSGESGFCGGRNLFEDQSLVHFSDPKFYESVPIFFVQVVFIQAGYDAFSSLLNDFSKVQCYIVAKSFHSNLLPPRPCS